jgi:hypothetical protein
MSSLNKDHWIINFLINYYKLKNYEQLQPHLWFYWIIEINSVDHFTSSYFIDHKNVTKCTLDRFNDKNKILNIDVDIVVQYSIEKPYSIRSLLKLNKLIRRRRNKNLKRLCKHVIISNNINYKDENIPTDLITYLDN